MGLLRREISLFITLMAFWVILSGELTIRYLVSGFFGCVAAIGIYNWILKYSGADRVRWIPLATTLRFGGVLAYEILLSAWQHLRRIISGNGGTATCRIILSGEEPLTVTLIANAITLTPGTVTMEADRNILTVLCYGDTPYQCPLDLVLMADRLQRVFSESGESVKEANHA